MHRRWSRRARLQLAGIVGPVALALYRAADALLDLPPGVEARHYLGREIVPPATSYFDD